jgi:hypothetical protein
MKNIKLFRILLQKGIAKEKIRSANLSGANLSGADLRSTNLSEIKTNYQTLFFNISCPEIGSFVGYKKANGYIIKLSIPATAKRLSATSYKCRCDKAKVLSIENLDGTKSNLKEIDSNYDDRFIYEIGKIVEVDNFDENRWNECSTGIHFFINRLNAVNHD